MLADWIGSSCPASMYPVWPTATVIRGADTTRISPASASSWKLTSTLTPASENVCMSFSTDPCTGAAAPAGAAAASRNRLALNVLASCCPPSVASRFSSSSDPCWKSKSWLTSKILAVISTCRGGTSSRASRSTRPGRAACRT
jgi:hypothetical protein